MKQKGRTNPTIKEVAEVAGGAYHVYHDEVVKLGIKIGAMIDEEFNDRNIAISEPGGPAMTKTGYTMHGTEQLYISKAKTTCIHTIVNMLTFSLRHGITKKEFDANIKAFQLTLRTGGQL